MYRYALACVLVALVAGCDDLTASVPPPPVPLSVLTGRPEGAAAENLITGSKSEVRLLRAVSPRTLLALHLPDIGGSVKRFQETGLYKWFTSKEVRDELGEAGELWARWDVPEGAAAGGADFKRLSRALLQGEFVFAVEELNFDEGAGFFDQRLLMGATVTGAEQEAQKLLQMIDMAAAAQEGVHVEKGSVGGAAYSRIIARKPVPAVIEVALVHDALLIGVGRESVTDAMERLQDEDADTLADDADFLRGMERCGDPRDAIRLYAGLDQLEQRYATQLPPETRHVLKALGLDNLRSATAAVRMEGIDIGVSTLLDSPGGKDCFTELLAGHSVDRRFLERMPADTSSFSVFALEGRKIIQMIRNALSGEMRTSFEDGLASLRDMRIDLETEVFDVFGPRCALVHVPTERLDGPGLDALWNQLLGTALICEVQDPQRAAEILARLPERTTLSTRREIKIEGIPAWTYTFQTEELPPDFAVTYALDEGYFLVAPTQRTLERLLRRRSPETTERFRRLCEPVPENAVVMSFDDLSRGPGIYLETLAHEFEVRAGNGPTRPRLPTRRHNLLQQYGSSISWTVADDKGVYSFTRSPTGGFGSIGGLSGLAVIAAIAVPNLHQARVSTNETTAIATMHAIHTAQETYRANVLRDTDGDGFGEYAYLGELLGQARAGEKTVRAPNPLVNGAFVRDGKDFLRSGYYFRVYLPAEDGSPVGENEPRRVEDVDGDLAEAVMAVVAWPVNQGISGQRAFYLDGDGRLYACANGDYSKDKPPPADVLSTQPGNMAAKPIRDGELARDGSRWSRIR